jgi:hypothetical protein
MEAYLNTLRQMKTAKIDEINYLCERLHEIWWSLDVKEKVQIEEKVRAEQDYACEI